MSLSDYNQAILFTLLDDIFNINNVYFNNMVSQIYPSDFQLYKLIPLIPKPSFFYMHLSISNDIVSTKIMISVTILILKLLRSSSDKAYIFPS